MPTKGTTATICGIESDAKARSPSFPHAKGFANAAYDKERHKHRNVVERFLNRVEHFRRLATRYQKTMINYLGFLSLAFAMTLG